MSLLKFFLNRSSEAASPQGDDPLSHPQIATMSLRQMADLPSNYAAPKPTRYETRPLTKCA
ncbi:hypothetical protein AM571_CH01074 [Rhizobium etli 8C-3]|jgi:hypothetical protein|uniref:Uncharacterized protein n=2 Tax=Rhizobium TaxID=379 RepID=A0A4R3QZV0_9HYPH|nr:hypothetical protein AM571_CH01074 [Rhizobium etli 8C-3]TCU27741.1 hypothetical protein EV130_103144 [Rhizobium azibense]TCU34528.1 hypothetical protein EV129_112144 [Rhizobium azibense]